MRCSRDRRAISLIRLTRCGHPKRGILGAPNQSLATMSAIGIFGQLVHSWRRLIPGLLTSHYRTLAEHGFALPLSIRNRRGSNLGVISPDVDLACVLGSSSSTFCAHSA
jgi:hypothetical protein